jgi:hypothetical protein
VLQVYIAMDPVMNEYYNPELEEYLKRFANMCEKGAFKAFQEVVSYIEDGININGLTIWLRLKGSVQDTHLEVLTRETTDIYDLLDF